MTAFMLTRFSWRWALFTWIIAIGCPSAVFAFPTLRPLPRAVQDIQNANPGWRILRDHHQADRFYVLPKQFLLQSQKHRFQAVHEQACSTVDAFNETEGKLVQIERNKTDFLLLRANALNKSIEYGQERMSASTRLAELKADPNASPQEIASVESRIAAIDRYLQDLKSNREYWDREIRSLELAVEEIRGSLKDLERSIFRATSSFVAEFTLPDLSKVARELGFGGAEVVEYPEMIGFSALPLGAYSASGMLSLEELTHFDAGTRRFSAFWTEPQLDYSVAVLQSTTEYERLRAKQIPQKLTFQRALTLKDFCSVRGLDLTKVWAESYQLQFTIPVWADSGLHRLIGQSIFEANLQITETIGRLLHAFVDNSSATPGSSVEEDLGHPQRFSGAPRGQFEPVTFWPDVEWSRQ